MKMPILKFLLVLTALTALGLTLILRLTRDHYEFHPVANGLVMWRCDHQTGDVDWAKIGGTWQIVTTDWATILADAETKDNALSNYAYQHTPAFIPPAPTEIEQVGTNTFTADQALTPP